MIPLYSVTNCMRTFLTALVFSTFICNDQQDVHGARFKQHYAYSNRKFELVSCPVSVLQSCTSQNQNRFAPRSLECYTSGTSACSISGGQVNLGDMICLGSSCTQCKIEIHITQTFSRIENAVLCGNDAKCSTK